MNKVLSIIIGFTCVFFVALAVTIIYGAYVTGQQIQQKQKQQQQLEQQQQLIVDHQCVQKGEALMTGYPVPRANVTAYNAECGALLPLPPGIKINETL